MSRKGRGISWCTHVFVSNTARSPSAISEHDKHTMHISFSIVSAVSNPLARAQYRSSGRSESALILWYLGTPQSGTQFHHRRILLGKYQSYRGLARILLEQGWPTQSIAVGFGFLWKFICCLSTIYSSSFDSVFWINPPLRRSLLPGENSWMKIPKQSDWCTIRILPSLLPE